EQARKLVARTDIDAEQDPRQRVDLMYRAVLARAPKSDEVDLALRFLDSELSQPPPIAQGPPTPWKYGYGEFDETTQRIKRFRPFIHFTGATWQGGPTLPDDLTGWAMLTATGGHPGNDPQHAVVRRWTAPRDCTISITGTISHMNSDGDGIRARIVTPREHVLASWVIFKKEAATNIASIEVRQAENVDFIVDCRSNPSHDSFTWKIHLTKQASANAVAGDDTGNEWDAAQQFADPAAKPLAPLTPWQKYAQVLLQSNEFAFVE